MDDDTVDDDIVDDDAVGEGAAYEPTPWHFKLLVLALVLYLAYRLVQLTVWLIHQVG